MKSNSPFLKIDGILERKIIDSLSTPKNFRKPLKLSDYKSKPFVNINNDFVLISSKFLHYALHKSTYFKLKDVYDYLATNSLFEKINFRQYYTSVISETYVFNKVINHISSNWQVKIGSQELKSISNGKSIADYVVSDDKTILIFENKDSFYPEDMLNNPTMDNIDKRIKEIFYEKVDTKNNKTSPKAIKQLINTIDIIEEHRFDFYRASSKGQFHIFPIVVIHDNEWSNPALQYICAELFSKTIKDKEYGGNLMIHPLTIVTIECLINLADKFVDDKRLFHTSILNYHSNWKEIKSKFIKKQRSIYNSKSKAASNVQPFDDYLYKVLANPVTDKFGSFFLSESKDLLRHINSIDL